MRILQREGAKRQVREILLKRRQPTIDDGFAATIAALTLDDAQLDHILLSLLRLRRRSDRSDDDGSNERQTSKQRGR